MRRSWPLCKRKRTMLRRMQARQKSRQCEGREPNSGHVSVTRLVLPVCFIVSLAYRESQDKAIAAYEVLFEKTGPLGTKIDIVLAIIRIGLFFGDKLFVKKQVDRASILVESGGDWDRRNRLKAYKG